MLATPSAKPPLSGGPEMSVWPLPAIVTETRLERPNAREECSR